MPLMNEIEFRELETKYYTEFEKLQRLNYLNKVKEQIKNTHYIPIGFIVSISREQQEKNCNFAIDLIDEEIKEIEK